MLLRLTGCIFALLLSLPALGSTVACNSTAITINAVGSATPYQSTITLPGSPLQILNVLVTINGLSHTYADDVGILLQGPDNETLLLQDGSSDGPVVNVTYSFSDFSGSRLPDTDVFQSGVYRPTSYYSGDPFPPPGPGGTYGNPGPAASEKATFASQFGGLSATGTWSLFVRDFGVGEAGSIADGWCLAINDIVFADPFGF